MNKGWVATMKLLVVPTAIAVIALFLMLAAQPARHNTVPAVLPANQLSGLFQLQHPVLGTLSNTLSTDPFGFQPQMTVRYIFTDRTIIPDHPRLDLIDKVN